MTSTILNHLSELQPHSGKKLNGIFRDILQDHSMPRALVKQKLASNGNWRTIPRHGIDSLSQPQNRQSIRKTRTLVRSDEISIVRRLNDALLGGRSYPVLTSILSTAAGAISAGAGLFFTIGSTGLTLTQTSQRVLARVGDQIFHVEEIGKCGQHNSITYVSSFFIIDPYRTTAHNKGWLIHEEREEIVL